MADLILLLVSQNFHPRSAWHDFAFYFTSDQGILHFVRLMKWIQLSGWLTFDAKMGGIIVDMFVRVKQSCLLGQKIKGVLRVFNLLQFLSSLKAGKNRPLLNILHAHFLHKFFIHTNKTWVQIIVRIIYSCLYKGIFNFVFKCHPRHAL